MAKLTPEAERIWLDFQDEIQKVAAHSGLDADDLATSLSEHLEELSGDNSLNETEVKLLVGRLRAEILAEADELKPRESSARESWGPALVSQGLFLLSLLTFPLIGPVLAIPAWITSRTLAKNAQEHYALVIFPAIVFSLVAMLSVAMAVGYFPVMLLSQLGLIQGPWLVAVFGVLCLLASSLQLWIFRRHVKWLSEAIHPVDAFIRNAIPLSMSRSLLIFSALLLVLITAVAIYAS